MALYHVTLGDQGLMLDLATYKGIQTPWNGWPFLEARSRFWAGRLSALVLGSEP